MCEYIAIWCIFQGIDEAVEEFTFLQQKRAELRDCTV